MDNQMKDDIYEKLDVFHKMAWIHSIYTGYPFYKFNKIY